MEKVRIVLKICSCYHKIRYEKNDVVAADPPRPLLQRSGGPALRKPESILINQIERATHVFDWDLTAFQLLDEFIALRWGPLCLLFRHLLMLFVLALFC